MRGTTAREGKSPLRGTAVRPPSPAAPPNAAGGRAPAPGAEKGRVGEPPHSQPARRRDALCSRTAVLGRRSRPLSDVMTVLKLSLMAFSFVFWAAGLTMLIVGLWAKVRLGGYLALSASDSPSAPAILLATGTAVIVWAFLGCFSAATEHRGLLRTYGVFLAAVLLAGLTAGLSALLYRQDIARGFREGLRQALSAYGEDEGKADALDALQRTLGCCGVESYRDWLASPWALQQNASVPLSCCRARRGCSLSSAGTRGLHPEGCFGKVSAFVSSNMFCIATAALGLAVLQVVGIVLACLMAVRVPAHITALH